MVVYKLETDHPDNPLGRWVVIAMLGNHLSIAMLGNHLSWEVGRYADERKAHERLSRIHVMMLADAVTN